ncbi:hypothetical protein PC129_g17057 [Phytophthora cactorum]|uniref:Uncharacterized protein n=1 Tax=Phytophthora cactorum TaxID=29920 RepID=A0A329SWZ7_9STRA|nr:hypothetical protein GQ600_19492 [Phytophthora cactorum]KAG2780509.1 hypothetical protein Pcac1_g9454 [Phytophthora cactorum]KAG2805081.1 hypothetical protein PC112_g18427 [Phytophthora cactorum]KAG2806463.1 hypothetical protein PC111_g17359 [Phytophthora cactorum]KAG2844487.1 hypothetical protein PC113_g18386 [Phytophthora cactorum]
MDAAGDAPAALSEQELLASLPPPPSALPDYPGPSNATDKEHSTSEAASEDAPDGNSRSSSSSKLPVSAAKASSAARSMASKLAKSGRKVLSPLGHSSKNSSSKSAATASPASQSEVETTSPSSIDAAIADPLSSVASAAGSLTSGLTSSLASASSSFGSLLFASQSSSVSNTDDGEERSSCADRATEEAAAVAAEAAEVLRQVTAQQRMRILEDLVQHRRSDWNYLKAMHEGSNYWLNVALLREQQVMNHVGYKQSIRRGAQFFYLGIGLGRLVGESTHPELLAMDCCQLLEELEFYFSSSTVQGMKMMVATSSTLHEPLDKENSPQYSADEPFRPTMHKWNQRPVFRRLMTPPIPFPLDYREVLLSLCDILALIYSKLIEDNSASENLNLFQSIIRFDDRIKKLFIDPVKKEFSVVASQVMAEEMRLVRKAYASGSREGESLAASPSESVENTPDTGVDGSLAV